MNIPRWLLIAGLLAVVARVMAEDRSPAQDIARNVDSYYNHLRGFRAHFTESYQGAGEARSESGTLLLSKPGKMRWDYKEPYPKLFLVDGKSAYFYVPGQPQAQQVSAKELDDLRSPLRFLLGRTRLETELVNLRLSSLSNSELQLEGGLKGMEDRIAGVTLTVTPAGMMKGIRVEEQDGAVTTFRFSDFEPNPPIPANTFHFQPPPGVTIVKGSNP